MTTKTEVKTCPRNHPLAGDNLYEHRGRRECVTCRRDQRRRRRHGGAPLYAIETLTHVSNEPLRERFLQMEAAGEITANSVALALRWLPPEAVRSEGRGDTQRVRRALGLVPAFEGKSESSHGVERYSRLRPTVEYETAVKIALVLGMDPHEAGV